MVLGTWMAMAMPECRRLASTRVGSHRHGAGFHIHQRGYWTERHETTTGVHSLGCSSGGHGRRRRLRRLAACAACGGAPRGPGAYVTQGASAPCARRVRTAEGRPTPRATASIGVRVASRRPRATHYRARPGRGRVVASPRVCASRSGRNGRVLGAGAAVALSCEQQAAQPEASGRHSGSQRQRRDASPPGRAGPPPLTAPHPAPHPLHGYAGLTLARPGWPGLAESSCCAEWSWSSRAEPRGEPELNEETPSLPAPFSALGRPRSPPRHRAARRASLASSSPFLPAALSLGPAPRGGSPRRPAPPSSVFPTLG